MRFRVVCGFDVTIAIFCPTRRFTNVDFPAFGRPTIATNPDLRAAPVFTFSSTLMVGSHASRCLTTFVFSLAILSAGSLPVLQNEILPNRIFRPEQELFRLHGSTNPQSSLPSRPPILQNARPTFLPHPQSPCFRALPANLFLREPFPASDGCCPLRPLRQFLPPGLPSSQSPQRFRAHP